MGTAHTYSAIYLLTDEQGKILTGTPWRITTPSGQVATGFSDEQGFTLPIYTRAEEEAELHILQKKPQLQEPLWFIGDVSEESFETEYRESK
jgi:type VI secretion system secreted protein VgrG